jgi:hypothetical protein
MKSNRVNIKYIDKHRFNRVDVTKYYKGIKVHATLYINKVYKKIRKNLDGIKILKYWLKKLLI